MISFVKDGKYYIRKEKVLMKDLDEKVFFVDMIIQILPSLNQGLNICVFFIRLQGQPVIVVDSRAQILNYSV